MTVYVISPHYSTPSWFDTEEEAQAFALKRDGRVVPEEQIHPAFRRPEGIRGERA